MSNFDVKLNQARTGNSILFCGAGYSADCLNFEAPEEIGVGAHLLSSINAELRLIGAPHTFKSVQNAAGEYSKRFGEHGLMKLLVDRFKLQKVSDDMIEIARFPWTRIYTTNYDNGLELSCHQAGKKAHAVNNLNPIPAEDIKNTIIHLHGFIDHWSIQNFKNSCILDASSYLSLSGVKKWLQTLRDDIDRAQFVAFVGFSANDFHLNRVLFNSSSVRDKIFFINQPTAAPDPDVQATQGLFGTSLYIGRAGLAQKMRSALAATLPTEPPTSSFRRFRPAAPSTDVPEVPQIEALFLFGRIDHNHLARDSASDTSKYHVRRAFVERLHREVIEGTLNSALVVGDVCDGKSLAMEVLAERLAVTRPVYFLRHAYEDLLDEASKIVSMQPNAAFIIENCLDFRDDRLVGVARICGGPGTVMFLTSRTIAFEAESQKLAALKGACKLEVIHIPPLSEDEAITLARLVDQFAGWRSLPAATDSDRLRFIQRTCSNSLPSFQLRLLKSEYVISRYKEEYNKSAYLSEEEKRAIIVSLYIAHIGHKVPNRTISEAFSFDVGDLADRQTKQADGLRLIHRDGDFILTVPAIGATNILQHMVADEEIVASLVSFLTHLSDLENPNDFERFIFGQLMRYSILKSVVNEKVHVNRFFDNISAVSYFRKQVLFWLQWHIAKVDQGEFQNAEKYLDNGYAEAKAYERRIQRPYDTKQLDDRKAKFLMMRAKQQPRDQDVLFRDLKTSWEIVGRLLKKDALTHHPFETLALICEVLATEANSTTPLGEIARKSISGVLAVASARISKVPDGYQRTAAIMAMQKCNVHFSSHP